MAPRLDVASALPEGQAIWTLSGATSNERYVTREKKRLLVEKRQGLGWPDAVRALRATPEWRDVEREVEVRVVRPGA